MPETRRRSGLEAMREMFKIINVGGCTLRLCNDPGIRATGEQIASLDRVVGIKISGRFRRVARILEESVTFPPPTAIRILGCSPIERIERASASKSGTEGNTI